MKYTVQATQIILNVKPTRVKQRFLVEADSEEKAYDEFKKASKNMVFRNGIKKLTILKTHLSFINE
tara:strand:- start:2985 stop:3182 length:198 start_codon:yes stop_codon:yes gene_type:complete